MSYHDNDDDDKKRKEDRHKHKGTHPHKHSHHSGNKVSNPNVVHHHHIDEHRTHQTNRHIHHQGGKSHNVIQHNPNLLPHGIHKTPGNKPTGAKTTAPPRSTQGLKEIKLPNKGAKYVPSRSAPIKSTAGLKDASKGLSSIRSTAGLTDASKYIPKEKPAQHVGVKFGVGNPIPPYAVNVGQHDDVSKTPPVYTVNPTGGSKQPNERHTSWWESLAGALGL